MGLENILSGGKKLFLSASPMQNLVFSSLLSCYKLVSTSVFSFSHNHVSLSWFSESCQGSVFPVLLLDNFLCSHPSCSLSLSNLRNPELPSLSSLNAPLLFVSSCSQLQPVMLHNQERWSLPSQPSISLVSSNIQGLANYHSIPCFPQYFFLSENKYFFLSENLSSRFPHLGFSHLFSLVPNPFH